MLKQMKETVEAIEGLVMELRDMGQGAPVIEKNTRSLMSILYALKFGISDVADVTQD